MNTFIEHIQLDENMDLAKALATKLAYDFSQNKLATGDSFAVKKFNKGFLFVVNNWGDWKTANRGNDETTMTPDTIKGVDKVVKFRADRNKDFDIEWTVENEGEILVTVVPKKGSTKSAENNPVLATGSYDAVMKKLYKIDQSAALATAKIKNSNGTHKGKTDTYYTTKIAGKYHLTKDKPLS